MGQPNLFLRQMKIIVGLPGKEGKEFEGLRMSFEIEKNSESFANPGKFTIYNLNKDSRSLLEKKGLQIQCFIGYLDTLTKIYVGDVQKVKNEHNGVDWVSSIEAGDGEQAIQESTIDKSYQPGISIKSVIGDVLGSFSGLSIGAQDGIKEESFSNGLALSGSSADVLTDLTKKQGLEWSVQDGEIQILGPKDKTKEEAILITSKTGLIGSPSKREEGIEFKTLLIPTIRPGRPIKLESKSINGVFRVRKAVFAGDNTEGEFGVKVEAV